MERPKRLSATFCKTVNSPGRYGEGRGSNGLTLLVKQSPNGGVTKSWTQRLRLNGKPIDLGLGRYPLVSLAAARATALDNARAVADGTDPRVKPQLAPTFAQAAGQAISVLRAGWKNQRTEKIMRERLDKYVLPHIGQRRINSITPADVLTFLAPLTVQTPATGAKVKAAMNQIFKWSIAQGYRQDNPADANINQALPKMTTRDHFKALPHNKVGAVIEEVRNSTAWISTKLAFEFLVLTATRSGEVRNADWSEIDLEGRTWTIPSSRMKAGREHRVPLSEGALDILDAARSLSDGQGLVFPSIGGKPMSDNTLSKMLRELQIQATPHGFRSSFRDWCAEQNIDRQIAESALAHSVGNATEAAYLRSDMFDLRRAIMDAWGTHLTDNDIADNIYPPVNPRS